MAQAKLCSRVLGHAVCASAAADWLFGHCPSPTHMTHSLPAETPRALGMAPAAEHLSRHSGLLLAATRLHLQDPSPSFLSHLLFFCSTTSLLARTASICQLIPYFLRQKLQKVSNMRFFFLFGDVKWTTSQCFLSRYMQSCLATLHCGV